MNKFFMILGLSTIAFSPLTYVTAEEPHAHDEHEHEGEENSDHYKAIEIETSAQAFVILNEKTAAIGDVLKKDTELEFLELEAIHEITYTLEAGVDKVRADNAAETGKIDALDEAIQAVHYASENQEEEKVRTWFVKLQAAVVDIKTVTPDDVKPVKQAFYNIIIKDHKFTPEEIIVPAGEKIKLIVDNQDPTPEEFESDDMNREKIIGGNKKATIFVGPLKPGKYHFFGEFNLKTANGYIIAK
ncbi:MAG: DUF6746 family protein [Alphaproteobacteria bacterium]